jgi:ubiquinone/menaquinone biosynthesis C-methylase UbiE
MYASPLNFLGPIGGKRILMWGVGAEAVGFALAGADVYGFDNCAKQVESMKDLARRLGLRDQTHLQTMEIGQLAYPDEYFDLAFAKAVREEADLETGIGELVRVLKQGARAVFMVPAGTPAEYLMRRAFGSAVFGECWIGVEKKEAGKPESHWSDLNRRPLDYESRALPLSYSGGTSDALARIRTATPFGTTPSR